MKEEWKKENIPFHTCIATTHVNNQTVIWTLLQAEFPVIRENSFGRAARKRERTVFIIIINCVYSIN